MSCVSGRMEWFNGRPTMVHPDHIALASEADNLPLVEPVYPLTAGLSRQGAAPGDRPGARSRRRCCPNGSTTTLHAPTDLSGLRRRAAARCTIRADPIDVSADGAGAGGGSPMTSSWPARCRWRWCAQRSAGSSGRPLTGDGRIVEALRAALPYSLTGSQERALAEIDADLAEPERMLRLLQGDVGSGKTVVALLAMARAVEAGGQAALMAPTEILARQHFATHRAAGRARPACASRS